ncbi:MAG: hypothetical protein PHU53_04215 [Thermoplasmata archaeon]|nr:hypothetical protein [Thermoplasmata archaeon]
MTEPLELCQAILHLGPEEEVDLHAEKELKRHFYEYNASQKKALASLSFMINGKEYDSLLEAIRDEEHLENAGIRFLRPDLKENWDFNTPAKTLVLLEKGMGWLERFSYDPYSLDKWDRNQQIQRENVMIRGFLARFYYPQSIITESEDPLAGPGRPYIPKLTMLEDLWTHVRESGMVPFEIRVCAYTKTARYTYDLDLINNTMLKDFRGGQSPLRNLAKRTMIDYLNFDTVLAATDMKDLVKRAFINLFESEFATAPDIAYSMHITNQNATNALNAIVSRGLATKQGAAPREIYTIDSEGLANRAKKFEGV